MIGILDLLPNLNNEILKFVKSHENRYSLGIHTVKQSLTVTIQFCTVVILNDLKVDIVIRRHVISTLIDITLCVTCKILAVHIPMLHVGLCWVCTQQLNTGFRRGRSSIPIAALGKVCHVKNTWGIWLSGRVMSVFIIMVCDLNHYLICISL